MDIQSPINSQKRTIARHTQNVVLQLFQYRAILNTVSDYHLHLSVEHKLVVTRIPILFLVNQDQHRGKIENSIHLHWMIYRQNHFQIVEV